MCASVNVVNPWGLQKQSAFCPIFSFCSCLGCCRSRKVVDVATSTTPTPILALTDPPLSDEK